MNVDDFIKNFADELEMTPREVIKPSTVYKDLEEWDSLMGLSIIAMISKKYHVKVSGSEIRDNKTIDDLFNLVSARL